MGSAYQINIPIRQAPNKDPRVPIRVIPPESPCCMGNNVIMDTGFFFDNFPNSVAHVSDMAAVTEDRNKKKRIGSGFK